MDWWALCRVVGRWGVGGGCVVMGYLVGEGGRERRRAVRCTPCPVCVVMGWGLGF